MPLRRQSIALAFPLAAVLSGCESEPPTTPPQVPYAFLASRVEASLEEVEAARSAMGGEGAREVTPEAPEVAERLARASAGLRRVLDYFIPVLEARFQVGRALELAVASPGASRTAIDSAGTIVGKISAGYGERLAREMREPLARLDEARTALEAGRTDEARRVLGRLGEQLELLYFRGELVLEGSELDSPSPEDERD